jgi:hypothetical protein
MSSFIRFHVLLLIAWHEFIFPDFDDNCNVQKFAQLIEKRCNILRQFFNALDILGMQVFVIPNEETCFSAKGAVLVVEQLEVGGRHVRLEGVPLLERQQHAVGGLRYWNIIS